MVSHAQTVSINEFMASNATTISDEDGDYEDWIELYNYGDEPVNLEGWGLSDNFSNPFRWVFPDIAIGPGDFLLVWASGKDRNEGVLHTNFSIDSSGEELLLVHPTGNWVDVVNPVYLPTDISYGRKPDGTGSWFYFDEATPGLSNTSEGFHGILPPPVFSHSGGFYDEEFLLEITHPDSEAVIYYTLDGSEPDVGNIDGTTYVYKNQYPENPGDTPGEFLTASFTSHIFDQSISIKNRSPEADSLTQISSTWHFNPGYFPEQSVTKGTVVRARAVKDGFLASPVITHSFFVKNSDKINYSLPVLSLSTNEANLFDYEHGVYVAGVDFDTWRLNNPDTEPNWNIGANFNRSGVDWEFTGHIEFFEDNGNLGFNQDIGFRIHGGSSRTLPAKSFRLYARNRYGNELINFPVFKEEKFDSFKRLILRNSGQDWQSALFRDPAIQHIVKHLKFDTQAHRPLILFINGEYWGIFNFRERYDKHYLESVHGVDKNNLDIVTNYYSADEGDMENINALFDYFDEHDFSLNENYAIAKTIIDIENFIDYNITQIFIANNDWPGSNTICWRLRTDSIRKNEISAHDGRWRWLMFDTDVGMGFWSWYDYNSLERATDPERGKATLFLRKLLDNDDFTVSFLNRFADLMNTTFLPERTISVIEEFKKSIEPEIEEHINRWSEPESYDEWNYNVSRIIEFLENRIVFQQEHLVDFFDLDGLFNVTVDVSHPLHGTININTLEIKPGQIGINNEPYPWKGSYFKDVPGTLEAVPAPGYEFSHWEGDYSGTDNIITINSETDFSVTAHFITTGEELLVHYWQFNDQLSNNMPLEEIPVYYTIANGARLTFESCLPEYPYYPGHPLWRQGSMERRNDPTPLNYQPGGNNDLPYNESDMRAIQIKQPLAYGNKVSSLVLDLPTTGIEKPVLRFAAKDEGAAKGLLIDYSTREDVSWQSLRNLYSFPLTDQYQLIEFDLSNVEAANDNPHLKVRMRFISDNAWAQDEKRIVFSNFTLDGEVCMTYTLRSIAEDNGQIFPSGFMNFSSCTRKEFLIVPNENHRIENVWLDGVSVIDDVEIADDFNGTYLFDAPYKNHELRASFVLDPLMHDEGNPIVLYPNPTSDALFIASENEINNIRLYDISGRLIYEYDCECNFHKLDMVNFNSGIYIVRIFTGKEIYTRKVQVLHPVF